MINRRKYISLWCQGPVETYYRLCGSYDFALIHRNMDKPYYLDAIYDSHLKLQGQALYELLGLLSEMNVCA